LTVNKIIILSTILFSAFRTSGQTEQEDIIILRKAIGKTPDCLITYVDKSTGWERMAEHLDNRKYEGQTTDTKQNSISLTNSEFNQLNQQIENYKDFSWGENLFDYSKSISSDSVLKYLAESNARLKKEQDDALSKMDTVTYYKLRKIEPWVFGFSKPLIFRDNTFCLLYIVALCSGTCGYDELAFYKKENGNWSKWVVVAHGEF
jgi:hypothetical protein